MHTPECEFCKVPIPPSEMDDHHKVCEDKRVFFHELQERYNVEIDPTPGLVIDTSHTYEDFVASETEKLRRRNKLPPIE